MRHLVLGSSGQIGAHLTHYLRSQGEDVLEFDILNEDYQDLRESNNPLLESYMEHSDMVYFLAFDVGGAKYLERYQDSYDFMINNMKIMTNTFELLSKYNLPFMFASSQMSEMSYSTYGVLKSLGERLTKSLGGLILQLDKTSIIFATSFIVDHLKLVICKFSVLGIVGYWRDNLYKHSQASSAYKNCLDSSPSVLILISPSYLAIFIKSVIT